MPWFLTRMEEQTGGRCVLMCSDLDNDRADLVNEDAANQSADGEEVLKKSRKKK